MPLPLCFVLMPFGKKPNTLGKTVDFDAVYADFIKPAIEAAGMEPLRADEELAGGSIHKPMFERLMLCDFAVADLSGANANVFYELGLRHGIRPATTALVYGEPETLPFDVAPLRAMPYKLNAAGKPEDTEAARVQLCKFLQQAKKSPHERPTDSPVFQLVEGYQAPDIGRLKTDVFREQAYYAAEVRKRLARARKKGQKAVRDTAATLGDIQSLETGVLIDLLLSYRATSDWTGMVDLVENMSPPLARSNLVQEQFAFALNRVDRGDEAEAVLVALIKARGASSETNGLLGRVYKDRWQAAINNGDTLAARGWLNKAVETYLKGFESDWRDAYPGINTVTLMELQEPPDPRRIELLTVVTYAVKRRVAVGTPDYWDHATLLELAVLRMDEDEAMDAAAAALAAVRESWEPETTARNLRLIRKVRESRNETVAWAKDIEAALVARARQ